MDLGLQGGGLALIGTALTLGLRHGVECHHLVAISDITGAATGAASSSAPKTRRTVDLVAIGLAALYAIGHALALVILGAGMLLAFVAGMLLSNTALAFVTSLRFLATCHARTAYLALGALAALTSVYVGTCALLGVSNRLPDLQQLIRCLVSGVLVS